MSKKEAAACVANMDNCCAFMLDYFQTVKENEPAVCKISNEAIDSVHKINRCLEEIKKTCGLRISKTQIG